MTSIAGPWADDLAVALDLADQADHVTMAAFGSADLVVETKPDLTPVSEADKETERLLRSQLAATRPGDAIMGEEYGSYDAGAARTWILDPIDGTKNYVRTVPVWATLIALRAEQEVVLGVVSAPALGRRWWAAKGSGAWTISPGSAEPRRIRVSGVSHLQDASFSYSDAVGWDKHGSGTGLDSLLTGTWRQRAYGDFWSHMLVAEGAVDVAGEPALETYDMAALIPIICEAGGMVSAYDGSHALVGGNLLSSNGLLHPAVLSLLNA